MDVTKQWDTMQSTDFIVSVIPELYLKLKRPELKDKIGKILQVIIEFTQGILSAKEWHRLAWTMQVMNYTYIRGDLEVQSKIKTIFIAAFEDFSGIRVGSKRMDCFYPTRIPLILHKCYVSPPGFRCTKLAPHFQEKYYHWTMEFSTTKPAFPIYQKKSDNLFALAVD